MSILSLLNNYRDRIVIHDSMDRGRVAVADIQRTVDTTAVFENKLKKEKKPLKCWNYLLYKYKLPGIKYCKLSCSSLSRSDFKHTAAPDNKMAAKRLHATAAQATP